MFEVFGRMIRKILRKVLPLRRIGLLGPLKLRLRRRRVAFSLMASPTSVARSRSLSPNTDTGPKCRRVRRAYNPVARASYN